MNKSQGRLGAVLALGAAATFFAVAPPAQATSDMMKKAKEAGIASVTNCQSCHTAKLPSKTSHEFNDMGNWLVKEKETRKAKAVDVTWLKEYVPPTK